MPENYYLSSVDKKLGLGLRYSRKTLSRARLDRLMAKKRAKKARKYEKYKDSSVI